MTSCSILEIISDVVSAGFSDAILLTCMYLNLLTFSWIRFNHKSFKILFWGVAVIISLPTHDIHWISDSLIKWLVLVSQCLLVCIHTREVSEIVFTVCKQVSFKQLGFSLKVTTWSELMVFVPVCRVHHLTHVASTRIALFPTYQGI